MASQPLGYGVSGGLVGTLGAPLLAAGLVTVSQRRVTRGITRRFFPQSVDFDRAIAEVSEQLTSADSRSAAVQLGQRLSEALGADPCVVLVRMKDSWLEKVWSTEGATPIDKIVGAVEGALEEHTSAIVMTDDGPILAARIGAGAAFPGMLLLGPRRGGQFYSTEDRRLITMLLNQMASILKEGSTQ